MSRFYPQHAVTLRVVWEDFKRGQSARSARFDKITVTAERLSVELNDYKTADTFSLSLDYRNFPFDPRIVRAIGVTIHIEDLKKSPFSGARITPSRDNTVFIGFVDKNRITFDSESNTVNFEGRDNTSLLIDARWDGGLLDMEQLTVSQVISDIVESLESTKDLDVEVRTKTGQTPTLAELGGGGGGDEATGSTEKLKNKRSSKKNDTYWDVIQDLVTRAGLICYVELDKLIITEPRTLFKKSTAKQFVLGKNLTKLQFKRKIGRFQDINIQVLSYNPRLTNPIVKANIPEEATEDLRERLHLPDGPIYIEKLNPKTGKPEKEIAETLLFRVPTIQNFTTRASAKEEVIRIGEAIFEEISRQQLEGKMSTREMCVYDREGVEFDITKLRIGTPVEIQVDNEYITGLRAVDSETRRYNYLLARGYEPKVATVLAELLGGYQTPFYTKACSFNFEANEGLTVNIDFVNFIDIDYVKVFNTDLSGVLP